MQRVNAMNAFLEAEAKLWDAPSYYKTGLSEIILCLNEDVGGTDRYPNLRFYGLNKL